MNLDYSRPQIEKIKTNASCIICVGVYVGEHQEMEKEVNILTRFLLICPSPMLSITTKDQRVSDWLITRIKSEEIGFLSFYLCEILTILINSNDCSK